jgi:hypothetical protein
VWPPRHDGGAASTRLGGRGGAQGRAKARFLPERWQRARAGVHVCVPRGVHRRAREGVPATRTRRGARHGAAGTRMARVLAQKRNGTTRAARAWRRQRHLQKNNPAWHDGRLHWRRRGGAEHDTFHTGAKAGGIHERRGMEALT